MKATTANTTVATVETVAPLASTVAPEKANATLRPLDSLLKLYTFDNERPTLKSGAKLDPEEIADVIAYKVEQAEGAKAQARFVYFDAGEAVRDALSKALQSRMTASAFYQLKSEAITLVPIALALEAEFGKRPDLSKLKEVSAAIKVGADGKPLPLDQQSIAGQKVLPMLKAGATQKQLREARAELPKSQGGTKKDAVIAAPVAQKTPAEIMEDAAKKRALNQATALGSFKAILSYLDGDTFDNAGKESAGVMMTEIARRMGWVLTLPTVKPTVANPPAK